MRSGIIILALLTVGTTAAVRARSVTSAQQRKAPPRAAQCWTGSPAVKNAAVGSKKLPLLTSELASKPVKRHAVALTLCIDEKGAVARSIVVVSSGNSDVDAFYQRATEKWKLKPATRAGKPVPSTADASANWTAR